MRCWTGCAGSRRSPAAAQIAGRDVVATLSGLLSFFGVFLVVLVAPALAPALFVQAFRLRSRRFAIAALGAAAIWAVGIAFLWSATSDPKFLWIFAWLAVLSVCVAGVGLLIATFAALAHPVRGSARQRDGAG